MTKDLKLSDEVVFFAAQGKIANFHQPSVTFSVSDYLLLMIILRRETSIVLEPTLHDYMESLTARRWASIQMRLTVEQGDLLALATTELHQSYMADLRKAFLDNRVAYPTFVGPEDGRNSKEITNKWTIVKQLCDLFDVLFFCVQNKREVVVEWK